VLTSHNNATIAGRVAQLQQGMAGQVPGDVLSVFAAEQVRMEAEGRPAGVAVPGDAMPDAQLLDVNGAPITLSEAVKGSGAVVVFYRGAWCPYCNLTLRAYQEDLVPHLAERGIPLVAISPQKPDGSLSTQETNELTFTVLSDAGNQLATALGVLTSHSEEALAAQRKLGLDLPEANADGTGGLPMPTVVVIDSAGIIRWIDVHPNYATRTEVADILDALRALA